MHLEGISYLLEDSELQVDNNQLVQKDNWSLLDRPDPIYFIPLINMLLPSLTVEVEAEKLSGQVVKDAPINNKTVIIGDSIMEWKSIQALLTEMGLQLIPVTKKTKWAENIITLQGKWVIGNCRI